MSKIETTTSASKLVATALAMSCLGIFPVVSYAAGPASIQLNPVLQSLGYFGTTYPTGAGYYGGYAGSYNYYQASYPQHYYTPAYSPYPYSNQFYTPYPHSCTPRPTSYRPTTTFVPTELTRHPPSMANPWFTSPDYRERHGLSGR